MNQDAVLYFKLPLNEGISFVEFYKRMGGIAKKRSGKQIESTIVDGKQNIVYLFPEAEVEQAKKEFTVTDYWKDLEKHVSEPKVEVLINF